MRGQDTTTAALLRRDRSTGGGGTRAASPSPRCAAAPAEWHRPDVLATDAFMTAAVHVSQGGTDLEFVRRGGAAPAKIGVATLLQAEIDDRLRVESRAWSCRRAKLLERRGILGSAYGIRTRVTAVRGRTPGPVDGCAEIAGDAEDTSRICRGSGGCNSAGSARFPSAGARGGRRRFPCGNVPPVGCRHA
jgi:hypothetical protein